MTFTEALGTRVDDSKLSGDPVAGGHDNESDVQITVCRVHHCNELFSSKDKKSTEAWSFRKEKGHLSSRLSLTHSE